MRFSKTKVIAGAAAAAAATVAVVALAAPASAAGPYAVKVGTNTTGTYPVTVGSSSTAISFQDTTSSSHPILNCTAINVPSTNASVTASASYAAGSTVGTVKPVNGNISGCTNNLAGPTTITVPTGASWGVVLDSGSGTTHAGRLTGITATITAAACTFTVGGTIDGTISTASSPTTLAANNAGADHLKITNTPVGAICTSLHLALGDSINVTTTLPISAAAGAITITP